MTKLPRIPRRGNSPFFHPSLWPFSNAWVTLRRKLRMNLNPLLPAKTEEGSPEDLPVADLAALEQAIE